MAVKIRDYDALAKAAQALLDKLEVVEEASKGGWRPLEWCEGVDSLHVMNWRKRVAVGWLLTLAMSVMGIWIYAIIRSAGGAPGPRAWAVAFGICVGVAAVVWSVVWSMEQIHHD